MVERESYRAQVAIFMLVTYIYFSNLQEISTFLVRYSIFIIVFNIEHRILNPPVVGHVLNDEVSQILLDSLVLQISSTF